MDTRRKSDDTLPKVTIGVLSWNRLHYLKATLESARLCIEYPNIEWIVLDNESNEPGLLEYLESLDWLDHLIVKKQSHADAMNQMVEMANGSMVMIWPDDVQFTVQGDWMVDVVEVLEANHDLGSMCLDFMRRRTIQEVFGASLWANRRLLREELAKFGRNWRKRRIIESRRGVLFHTFGWKKPGVCGSGIPSITRTEVWKNLGPWRTTFDAPGPENANIDSSLGAESDMVRRSYASARPLQGVIPMVPVAADIITDPLGCKAKIRGGCRYGVYMPPVDGPFYYQITRWSEWSGCDRTLPVDFTTGVTSIGFRIPIDENGDRKKHALNDSVVWDIQEQRTIDYPLRYSVEQEQAKKTGNR